MGRVVSYMNFKQGRELQFATQTNAKQTTDYDPLEMGSLVFRCPLTGREFDCGIGMDRQTFIIAALTKIVVRCKCCHQPYHWRVGNGVLVPFANSREEEEEIRTSPSLKAKCSRRRIDADPSGRAAEAGIESGDVILDVDYHAVDKPAEVRKRSDAARKQSNGVECRIGSVLTVPICSAGSGGR